MEGTRPWLRGTVTWNGIDIPVVSVEELCGEEGGEPGGRTRIAVIRSIRKQDELPCYGILSEGFPQMVRINPQVLEPDLDFHAPDGVPLICRVRMINELALIPDLEAIENQLEQATASVAT